MKFDRKKKHPSSRKNEFGFTLLEIILALGILATIGVITINILSDQISTRQKLGQLNDDQHSLDAALNRMARDIQGAYLPNPKLIAYLNIGNRSNPPKFVQGRDSIILFTFAYHSYLNGSNESNQAFVKYSMSANPKDASKMQLIRVTDTDFVDSIDKDDTGLSQTLLEDVESFKLQFWDGNKFRDDWDSTSGDTQNKLPKMVKIHLSSYSGAENQVATAADKKNRKFYTLDTVVFLNNSIGQKEVTTPTWSEYKWP